MKPQSATGSFTIAASELKRGLTAVAPLIESRMLGSIEAFVEIAQRDSGCALTVSGGSHIIRVPVHAAAANGRLLVRFDALARYASSLEGDAPCQIEAVDAFVRVQCGTGKARILTLADAPATPSVSFPEVRGVRVLAKNLEQAISAVKDAGAKQDVRQFMNGLLLESGDGVINVVATDGHRMGRARAPVVGGQGGQIRTLINSGYVAAVLRLLGSRAGNASEVELRVQGRVLGFALDGCELALITMTDPFPEYDRLLPTLAGSAWSVEVARSAISGALDRLMVVTERGGLEVAGLDGDLVLRAGGGPGKPEENESVEVCEAEIVGNVHGGVNSSYLRAAVRSLTGERVKLYGFDAASQKPIGVMASDTDDILHVIMPMRL